MSTWTSQEVDAAIQAIVRRASTDYEFRQLCLLDPAAAVLEESGKDLPTHYNLRFVDNRGADMTLVLPDPVEQEDELSDVELEQVAGGGKCLVSCGASCVGTCLCISIPTVTGV